MRSLLSAVNPSARAARARYGADGVEVRRLLGLLARLSPDGWEALVRANDAAGRRRPPESDASSLRQVDYLTAAGNDAAAIAFAAVGPEAAAAWRDELAGVAREQRGEDREPVATTQVALAEKAWSYQYVAQHMAWLVASAHRRGRTATRREWEPYEPIISIDAVLRRR
jgi:hypothetical protein